MKRLLYIATSVLAVSCFAIPAGAISLTLDGANIPSEPWVAGDLKATQLNPTGYGDSGGGVAGGGGSELNRLWSNFDTTTRILSIGITGNVEVNFNRLYILFDAEAGGENVLAADNVDGAPGTGIAGLANRFTFPGGVTMDHGLMIAVNNANAGFAPVDTHYVNFFNLITNTVSLVETGPPGIASFPFVNVGGANGIHVGWDNSNALGVTVADASTANTATSGFEIAIDTTIAFPGIQNEVKMVAYISGDNGSSLSNQSLPSFPAGTVNLGGGSYTYPQVITQFIGTPPPPPVPGDVDGDRDVDLADFEIIRMNWLATPASLGQPFLERNDGDLNGNQLVDINDFRDWKSHNPTPTQPGAGRLPRPLRPLACPSRAAWRLSAWLLGVCRLERRGVDRSFHSEFGGRRLAPFCKFHSSTALNSVFSRTHRDTDRTALTTGTSTMKAIIRCLAGPAVLLLLLAPSELRAQVDTWIGGTAPGLLWNTPANWDQGAVPDANQFFQFAIVGSTLGGTPSVVGVANVTSDIRATFPAPTVILGDGGGNTGTLNISSTGKLKVAEVGISTGDMVVGQVGGRGLLNIASGGVLEIDRNLNSFSAAAVGTTTTLTGTASVTVGGTANLNRTLVMDGSNANLTVVGDAIFGALGTHTWRIPATGASVIHVGGNADLGGTLKVEFPSGTPTLGSTWNLIDSATVDFDEDVPSSFANVDASAVAGLGAGQRFRVKTVDGAPLHKISQLVLEQHPILTINRQTGAMSLSNPGSAPTSGFDVYQIQSASGSLNPANWTSIAPASGWTEANPTNTALSELNPLGTGIIAASSSLSLGTPWAPVPAPFGTPNEDITFRYSLPGTALINGEVKYTGAARNTLTLNVNPTTGEAQIVNATNQTVSMDTYTINSASGSLNFANGSPANTWNSLDDQGTSGGNWFEANVDANQIAELLISGGLQVPANSAVNLGSPFKDVGGTQDLTFRFSILGGPLPGDFNINGVVDAADYTIWRNNLGAPTDAALNGNGDATPGVGAGDYSLWKSNFGSIQTGDDPVNARLLTGTVLYGPLLTFGAGGGSLALQSAVPEPSTPMLLIVGLSLAVVIVRPRI